MRRRWHKRGYMLYQHIFLLSCKITYSERIETGKVFFMQKNAECDFRMREECTPAHRKGG